MRVLAAKIQLKFFKLNLALALLLLGLGQSAIATTVAPESPTSLAQRAPVVVYGKVVQIDVASGSGFRTAIIESIDTARAPEEFRHIRDFYVPLLNRAIPHTDEVEVVIAAPELRLLEEVVVFLSPLPTREEGPYARVDGKRLFTLEGFYQGKLRVLEDKKGVRRVLAWNEVVEPEMKARDLQKQRTSGRLRLQSQSLAPTPVNLDKLEQALSLDKILNLSRQPQRLPK